MAGFTPVLTSTVLARTAGALFGLELSYTTMNSLVAAAGSTTASQTAFLNTLYANSVGASTANSVVVSVVMTNLGIPTTDTAVYGGVSAYIQAQLDAVPYAARGGVLNDALALFSTLTASPYVVAYNTKIANAEAYAAVSANTGNVSFDSVSTTASGQIFTLTVGVDTLTGTAGNDSYVATANGTGATFNPGDSIKDTGGTADSLTINDLGTGTLWAPTSLAGALFTGIETATLNGVGGVTANTTGTQLWTGLTALNVNSGTNGTVVDTITAAATTAVTLNDTITTKTTADGITITGGSTVTISENNVGFDESAQTINVTGVAGTTNVSVTQVGTLAGKAQAVTILDANNTSTTVANTITTVTLDGLDTQIAAVKSNVLSSLTINQVKTGGSTVNITEVAGSTGLSTALALGLNTSAAETLATTSAFTGVTINDANSQYKTLNITAGGTATKAGVNNINVTRFTNFTAVTAATVAGTGELIDLTSAGNNATDFAGLTSLSISGTGGLSMDVSSMGAKLTSVTATNTGSNINNIGLSGTLQSYTHTGSARDIITIGARETKTVTAGSATNNEIIYNAAGPGTGVALTNGGTLTGFTMIGTGAASTGTFDLNAITGITAIDVNAGGLTGATTFSNAAAGTTLAIDGAAGQTVSYTLANTLGAANALTMSVGVATTDARVISSLQAATTAGFTATTALAAKDSAGVGVGTLSIASYGSTAGTQNTITNLDDTKLTTLNISGTAGLVFTNNTTTADTATALTIANTSTGTGASGFTTLTDTALATLSFTGTGVTSIATALNTSVSALTINQNDTNSTAVSIATLTDASLNSLTITGTNAFTVGTNLATSQALLSIANTDAHSSGVTFVNVTDISLSTLNLSGTGKTTFTTLTDALAGGLSILDSNTGVTTISTLTAAALTSLTVQNSGSGTLTIGGHVGTALATLNLLGNVTYTMTADAVTGAITVAGSTDHANVSLAFTGTEGAVTDAITLGNGNNSVTFAQGGGTTSLRNVTFGNGNNTFTDSSTDANAVDNINVGSGTNSITFNSGGTHTVKDTLTFSAANAASATSITTVTNAVAADTITWANAALNTTITHSGAVASVAAGLASVNATNGYTDFTFGGNTYIYENTGTAANNELVAIVGTHTLASATTAVGTLA